MKPQQPDPLSGIVDIAFAAPVAPPTEPWLIWMAVVLALAIAALLLYWRLRSKKATGLRRLRQLSRACRQQRVDSRQAAFQLAAVIRQTFELSRLSADTPLPQRLQPQQSRWQQFNRQLADARYTVTAPTVEEIEQLLSEGSYWLRQWR